MPHTVEEAENADGWGFIVRDERGQMVRRVWNAPTDPKTDALIASTRELAEEEKRLLDEEAEQA